MLSKSLSYKLSSFGFITLATPVIGITLHAPAGYLIILVVSMFIGMLENTFKRALLFIYVGISRNFLLFIFASWYAIGAIIILLTRGNGLDDWRLMIAPISLIIGIFFAFAFMIDESCWRYLQIGVIIAWGIQSILSIPQLYFNPGLAREMWFQLAGSWIYGDQGYFALSAILLPVLFWRAFKETGVVKLILLFFCTLILIAAGISSFGTPLGLILGEICVTVVLALLFMGKKRGWIIVVTLIFFFYIGYRFVSTNPIFSEAYTRIENFINDPTTGGYSGRDLAVSRWYLNSISIESFLSDPFFGQGGSTRVSPYVGGHSSFLDALGTYGLLGGGGAFSCVILIMLINTVFSFLHERTWQNLLAIATMAALIVAGVINPYWEGSQPLLVILLARPFIRGIKSGATIQPESIVNSFTPYRVQQ